VETNRYPVPYEWCRAAVEVQLNEREVRIVHEGATVCYERETGKHRVVHWSGPARSLPRGAKTSAGATDPPRYDPAWLATVGDVDVRSLAAYEEVAQ
jgi:hypothetical protein